MDKKDLILLTGAAGFIGSYMLGALNRNGFENIIIADHFGEEKKLKNYEGKKFVQQIERDELFEWLAANNPPIKYVLHLGARTDTTEFDYSIHQKLNVDYSIHIWNYCTANKIPLIYASSAATYGAGELGYKDDHDIIEKLKPLNPYGVSKNEFDKWVLGEMENGKGKSENGEPPYWYGLKFFNVYGPNEYHKGRMASVIFHSFNQVVALGKVKLFRSHRPDYKDGEQLRDFVYVKDVADVCLWLMEHPVASGLYNLGTGKARTFLDLANAVFHSLDKIPEIEFIDTPVDIRDKYQYFTEAPMEKLKNAGYPGEFTSLEEGVGDYVREFLSKKKYY